jgi:PIN domain nuclease of toxin-antitoxin system
MPVLLDTHSFPWFVEGSPQLSVRARTTIEDVTNDRYLSVASVWEIAIKVRLGKLSFTAPVHDYLLEHLDRSVTNLLGIRFLHATSVAELPLHHRDPFDRLLITWPAR